MLDRKNLLNQKEYDFLKTDKRLQHLCYLTLHGSYAFGTNTETSDVDVRGFALGNRQDLILGKEFEQVESSEADTVIFGLRKFVSLLSNCNPSHIELLGTRKEDILFCNSVGTKMRDNISIFLSKKAYNTFAGYATSQLRRIQNAWAHYSYPNDEKENHIRKSLESSMLTLKEQYALNDGSFSFGLTDNGNPEETEVTVSCHVDDLPVRKFIAVNSDINNMIKNYDKLNHRNRKKDLPHLYKHAMHLVRLYHEGLDILNDGKVVVYREKDIPLYRKIRAAEIPFPEIFEMAEELDNELKKAKEKSPLPDNPDYQKIDKLMLEIYSQHLTKNSICA